jgi:hypothetical protein
MNITGHKNLITSHHQTGHYHLFSARDLQKIDEQTETFNRIGNQGSGTENHLHKKNFFFGHKLLHKNV